MSDQKLFSRLCALLCELDKLVKEYLFGKPRQCGADCGLSNDEYDETGHRARQE